MKSLAGVLYIIIISQFVLISDVDAQQTTPSMSAEPCLTAPEAFPDRCGSSGGGFENNRGYETGSNDEYNSGAQDGYNAARQDWIDRSKKTQEYLREYYGNDGSSGYSN